PALDTYPKMLAATGYLQPLYSLAIALLLLVFGTDHTYTIGLLLNGLFFGATIIGTYRLACKIFDNMTGIIAAIVFAGLGNALFYSHFSYTETAVTASIVWSLVYLAQSDGFTRRRETIIAGLLVSVAALTRWIAFVGVAGPVIVLAISAIGRMIQKPKSRKMIIVNLSLFGILAIGVPVVLYFAPNWSEFISYVQRNQQQAATWVAQYRFAEMVNTFSTRSVMYYFNILSQNTVYIFLVFILGVFVCLKNFRKTVFLLAAFIVPYIFLTFVAVWKEDRFLVPLYPVFAVIVASVVYAVRNKGSKITLTSVLIAISILNFLGSSWGIGPMGKRGLTDLVLPSYIHHPRRIYLTPLVWPPTKEYLNAHLIAQAIRESSLEKKMPVVLTAFTSEPLDNALQSIVWYQDRFLMQYKKLPFDIRDADFVITKSNDMHVEGMEQFVSIVNIPIPMDNSTVTVYKHEKK
ncbi:MAG: glycosyltransferase family 39 protein, partial [Patescibacteria group bacterium]